MYLKTKKMKSVLVAFVTLLFVGCGAAPVFDYNTTTDFTALKTYAFFPNIQSGLTQLDDDRIKQTLDSLLRTKNITPSTNPDILINYYAYQQLVAGSTIGVGVGSGGGNVGVGVSGGIPISGKKIEQNFTLDFISNPADALIWQGVITDSFKETATPAQKKTHYIKLLSKLINGFPPKK